MSAQLSDPGALPPSHKREESASGIRSWIVKATGVLLVVPALLNAAYDVYANVQKLPRTDAERLNTELFKKYFNKEPLARLPISITNEAGSENVKIAIYEGGEIFVEVGRASRWFVFTKADKPDRVSFSLVSTAFAQTSATSGQAAIASQKDAISGSTLIRSRTYTDGRTEQRKIDIRSGMTLSTETGSVPVASVPTPASGTRVFSMEPIDLQQLRARQRSQ
jgi:hypothetical protein